MAGSRRSATSQTKHDKKAKSLADSYRRRSYEVKADVMGYPQPQTIGGHRPDIIAKKGGHETVVEVETPDSINTAHAYAQDAAFTRFRRRGPKRHYVRVVVE